MKTTTLYRFTIALSLSLLSFGSFSQCSPNPIYTLLGIPGVWPNAMQGDLTGTENVSFSQVFTVIPPTDTTVNIDSILPLLGLGTINVPINYVKITNISGLPAGLSYTCNNSGCEWALGTNGCFIINGIPSNAGTFTVSVTLSTNIQIPVFGGFDLPGYDIDYTLIIAPTSVGIEQINNTDLSIKDITPNPFYQQTSVSYTSNGFETVQLNLYNAIGVLITSESKTPEKGQNKWTIDGARLSPGTYLATISNGRAHHTKKIILLK